MEYFKASTYPFTILCKTNNNNEIYPYFRSIYGDKIMRCISSHHGRSFIVGQHDNGRFVVSKGNGLSYSQYSLLYTREFGDNTLGLLLKQDAIRDFTIGIEIEHLDIKTNRMEYVIQLDKEIALTNGHVLNPILLQYSVECPYRICDAAFPKYSSAIKNEISKWKKYNDLGFDKHYLIAANILIRNLKILHTNNILHNAINFQNYTWALELLDFELACSPNYPYKEEDDQRHVKDLFNREILYTYEIIKYIACYLNESIDYKIIDDLFKEYGFDLSTLHIQV